MPNLRRAWVLNSHKRRGETMTSEMSSDQVPQSDSDKLTLLLDQSSQRTLFTKATAYYAKAVVYMLVGFGLLAAAATIALVSASAGGSGGEVALIFGGLLALVSCLFAWEAAFTGNKLTKTERSISLT